ncbi:vitelline membrane outer layer protein 1 homolog [Daphnia pulex]|uniref:vitelline membrane outer layer protein 1 homolog n=1 Tax=Daphnia pulex TaxID=6669 RepID=UPI001EDF47EF|nr:vitelline membrane outer layer protein 1 homolog [Daphnia pulex]
MLSLLRLASFVVACLLLAGTSTNALKIISVNNGEVQGIWGKLEVCPDGSAAIGYQTQNDQLDVPLHDKTALNSIRLFCNDTQGTNITSTLGDTGIWELRLNCPAGEALSSFRLRVEPYDSANSDNTAVNSIQFNCTDGSLLNYNGNTAGIWGEFSADQCETGICGLETLVQPLGGSLTDNTAVNDVVFICC